MKKWLLKTFFKKEVDKVARLYHYNELLKMRTKSWVHKDNLGINKMGVTYDMYIEKWAYFDNILEFV